MKDEIKEIKVNKANKSITFVNNGIAFSQFGVADEILDLITNLQEENERLKNGYCELKVKCNNGECDCTNEEYDGMVQANIRGSLLLDDYKSRNEKAIKLLKEAGCYEEDTKIFCSDIYQELPELLNILQGEDKQ